MANSIRLTDAKIKSLRPPKSGRIEIIDSVVPGLRVRLGHSDRKSFTLRKRVLSDFEIKAFWQACEQIGYPYNCERPHSSIGNKAPAELLREFG